MLRGWVKMLDVEDTPKLVCEFVELLHVLYEITCYHAVKTLQNSADRDIFFYLNAGSRVSQADHSVLRC